MATIFLEEAQFKDIFDSHIKIETYSRSIDSLFMGARTKNKIDYKPYYQRNYVWDDSKATYFIESILLGTEIPPLIFFDEGKNIEVIDGRQRFETIKRFIEGEFNLSKNGLTTLINLSKENIESLREKYPAIYEGFVTAKVRIIGFKLVNNPPSDPVLIDKIKKEIFGRYNSGITPLRRAEIDNAIYDSNELSKFFKARLKSNSEYKKNIARLFLRQISTDAEPDIESIMQFIRKSLVIYKFPIKAYASGKSRGELIHKFYGYSYSEIDDPEEIFNSFMEKIFLILEIEKYFNNNNLSTNRLFFECLLWAINILVCENVNVKAILETYKLDGLCEIVKNNSIYFDLVDSHYAKETVNRYSLIANFFEKHFYIKFSPYLQVEKSVKEMLKNVSPEDRGCKNELEKLESLRITKPDPSRNKIDDLMRAMNRTKFLVRPSYQRSEVINLAKSSAIIESILLGIMLPAVFIYKRKDGVSEVIDGQQRLLTILGFIGERYIDENSNYSFSKNHNFKLKNLRILKELNGKGFDSISEELQERILEFDLFIVEIEERLNPHFDAVDLFIRLNDKPFPIRENSFEMWNSWADKSVIDKIKETFMPTKEWFYIKKVGGEKFRDRMTNEELFTVLAHFDYSKKIQNRSIDSFLDIYQKGERINARIKRKAEITSTLVDISDKENQRTDFLDSIERTRLFVQKIKFLLGKDSEHDLKECLEQLMSSGSRRKYYARTLQDFYVLWNILNDINVTKENRDSLYKRIQEVFSYMKNIPNEYKENNLGYDEFIKLTNNIREVATLN